MLLRKRNNFGITVALIVAVCGHDNDVTYSHMGEYCATNPTSRPTLDNIQTNIICPPLSHVPKFTCPNDTATHFNTLSMKHFQTFLHDKKYKILFAGDSITEQMFGAYMCSLEAEEVAFDESNPNVLYSRGEMLATVNRLYEVRDARFDNIQSAEWFNVALRNNVTHVVLNTGAWFVPNRIRLVDSTVKTKDWRILTLKEVVTAFQLHFAPKSHLHRLLSELVHKHGIKLIWRDLAAAGSCDINTPKFRSFQYYEKFSKFNSIGRKAVVSLGGEVIPGIWEHSLTQWQHHVGSQTGNGDLLHWC
jgi:hypothetical protein